MTLLLQIIICRLLEDEEILTPLLQSRYFSWQAKILSAICQWGKNYTIRDVLLAVSDEVPLIYLLAALTRHGKAFPNISYHLTESEISQLTNYCSLPDGNFLPDLLSALAKSSLSKGEKDLVGKRLYKLVDYVDPKELNHFYPQSPTWELSIKIDLATIFNWLVPQGSYSSSVPEVTEIIDEPLLLKY